MLLSLANWLSTLNPDFQVFTYITLRTILSALTALDISLVFGPAFIRRLSRTQTRGQPIRNDGPETHLLKAGTPTMGGALILLAVVLATLLWSDLSVYYVWVTVLVTLAFGFIGWLDDYKKLVLDRKSVV
jgi:phospho-N-acetylmuramoyl-pentapeptide-transferase